MPVIAIIGAAPRLGRAVAMTFGARGFNVALLSHSPAMLESVVTELAEQGVEAAAFHVDVLDRASVASALAAAKQRFGQIDVLDFSPADQTLPRVPATELTYDDTQTQNYFHLHSAVVAVKQVLPAMLARRSGTIIFTTDASTAYPHLGHDLFAAFAQGLHAAVAPGGVQVGHVAICACIGRQPGAMPEAIAPLYWELHTQRDQVEKVFMPETAGEARASRGGVAREPKADPRGGGDFLRSVCMGG